MLNEIIKKTAKYLRKVKTYNFKNYEHKLKKKFEFLILYSSVVYIFYTRTLRVYNGNIQSNK